jgi:hypothetical protein
LQAAFWLVLQGRVEETSQPVVSRRRVTPPFRVARNRAPKRGRCKMRDFSQRRQGAETTGNRVENTLGVLARENISPLTCPTDR